MQGLWAPESGRIESLTSEATYFFDFTYNRDIRSCARSPPRSMDQIPAVEKARVQTLSLDQGPLTLAMPLSYSRTYFQIVMVPWSFLYSSSGGKVGNVDSSKLPGNAFLQRNTHL